MRVPCSLSKKPPDKTITAYKMFRVRADRKGELFPLFVDTKRVLCLVRGTTKTLRSGSMTRKAKESSGRNRGVYKICGRYFWQFRSTQIWGTRRRYSVYAASQGQWPQKAKADHIIRAILSGQRSKCLLTRTTQALRELTKQAEYPTLTMQLLKCQWIPRGFYSFTTNPVLRADPKMKGRWMIASAVKIIRIVPDEEVDEMVKKAGFEPIPRVGGPINPGKYGFDQEEGPAANFSSRPRQVKRK